MRTPRGFILAFLAPALALFCVFVAWPSLRALIYSLQRWDGLGTPEWIGLKNFQALFEDDLFLDALGHNLILCLGAGSITLVLSLLFASLMHRRIRGANLFRVVFFFPNVLSAVAIALIWMFMYSTTEFGAINALLEWIRPGLQAIGIHALDDALPFPFTDSKYLIVALLPMIIWTATGFYMVLFLAAMQSIPETYYEAARLDGASPLQQFWHVTFPMIREVLTVGIVFFVISSAKFFDAVWVMENQNPTPESHVMATVLYQKIFTEYNVGYGAAVAVLLFALVFVATVVTLRLSRKEALEF